MEYADILNSKTYVRQGSPALTPEEYIGPFIDKVSKYTSDIIIKTSHKQENANEDDTLNTAYGRLLVQATIPGYSPDGSDLVVGQVTSIDKQVPEHIFYGGHEVFACTNLIVHSDDQVCMFKDNHNAAHLKLSTYLEGIEKEMDRFVEFHNRLQSKELSMEDLDTTIGHIIRSCISKNSIGTTEVLHGYKEMLNPTSMYGVKDGFTDLWNVYGSITDSYSKKFNKNLALAERSTKTKALTKLFEELV